MTITFIVFIFVISILVLVHEMGHFLAAKKFGIKVEEFGLGLPPRIWGIKKGETIYSLNALPIGGFVKLFGEEGKDQESIKSKNQKIKKDFKRAFFAKPIWQRAVVLSAGVTMNFILAILVLSFLFTQGVFVPTDRVTVEKVEENSPAEEVGLKEADVIKEIKVDLSQDYPGRSLTQDSPGIEIKSAEKLINLTKEHLDEEIELVVLRAEEELTFKIMPRKDPPEGQGAMGIAISDFEEKTYPWYKAPFWGIYEAFKLSGVLVKGLGQTLWCLVTFQPIKEEVAGPVGIAQITGKAVKFGKMAILELLGLLSLNLAVVNILPFPALDGGRLLFLGIEATTGKKIRAKWERVAHQTGMAILLALLLLVTINDVLRIIRK